jgi:hypothetical protein
MAIALEKLPSSSGVVTRATIGSLMILAHTISVSSVSCHSQQVRGVKCFFSIDIYALFLFYNCCLVLISSFTLIVNACISFE